MKRYTVLGTSEFAKSCIDAIVDSGEQISQIVSLQKNLLPANSIDLEEISSNYNVPFLETEDINSPETIEGIRAQNPDFIFTSWSKILKREIIHVPKGFTIGTHPAPLPYNRGRHPLHWMIHLGINNSMLSFFKVDEGVDTGKVLLQVPFVISPTDTIADANSKLCETAYNGTKLLCNLLKTRDYTGIKQDESRANYWRKRTPYDSLLDPRMPSDLISRLVRSYSPPFPCANLLFRDFVIPVSKTQIIDSNLSREEIQRIEPGKIISVEGKRLRMKVDDGIIEIESPQNFPAEIHNVKYLHPPMKYLSDSYRNIDDVLDNIEGKK